MAIRSRRKRSPVQKANENVKKLKEELATLELKLLRKRKAESAYGSELSDLKRLIGELDQSILELPEGGLKSASIERRKELESRRQNLVLRYPKGTNLPEDYFIKHIALLQKELSRTEKLVEEHTQEAAKKIADAANGAASSA